MYLGRSLFGGAIAAGLITASGIAVCSAEATGQVEVYRFVAGEATATGQASGYCRRTAGTHPMVISCAASASGQAKADYLVASVITTAIAEASGAAQVDFSAYGAALGNGTMQGAPIRRLKLFPLSAKAYAELEGDGYIHEMGYGEPAVARAWGFGTTYQVGRGNLSVLSSGIATGSKATGGRGEGLAEASATGRMLYTGGAISAGIASALGWGDAAVSKAGVKHYECFGEALAESAGEVATVEIYQSQTGRAYATISAYPLHTVGAAGHGLAAAQAVGEGLSTATAVTSAPGFVTAAATARAAYLAGGLGHAQPSAMAAASALVTQTRVQSVPGGAIAQATGWGVRQAGTYGNAQCSAAVSISATKTQVAGASAGARASASSGQVILHIGSQAGFAAAQVAADGKRLMFGNGAAIASASAQGANQINDLVSAPVSRTFVLTPSPRLVAIGQESRLLAA